MDKQITAEVKGKHLVITIPLISPPSKSTSGKTLLVASSHGNQEVDLEIQGKPVKIGLNAYIKA